MKRRCLLAILCVAVLLPPGTHIRVASVLDSADAATSQQQAENVELVGQIGGAVESVALQGNYAYLGVGPRLVILDISDPAYPAVVGQTDVLFGVVRGVAVVGEYVYVAAGWPNGLRIIDVSNPAAPIEVGFCDTVGQAMRVTVAGNYAYVAAWGSGLRIVDVSEPAAPVEVAFYDTPGSAYNVAVVGNYAYVAARDGGLRIINVSDPTNPTEVAFYDTPHDALGVAAMGNYAYVADSGSGLRIIDVSDPAAPTEVGFYDTPGAAHDVALGGNYAYVADWGGGLRIIDVSNPAAPSEEGSYGTPDPAYDVALGGNYAYVAYWNAGLRIIDVSSPAAPAQVGFYDTPGAADDVALGGNYAYVADWNNGLRIIDVSNPAAPREVGFHPLWLPDGVAVAGNYAYVIAGLDLAIVDISDPANPTGSGAYYVGWDSNDVAVAGSYAYVAAGGGGLRIINVSDPANPTEVGFYDTPGGAPGVAVAGSYAYIADGDAGLRIINVSDPANPTEVGFYDTPGGARGVAVADSYAYIADGDAGLRIVNASNPAAPTEVGFYDTPKQAYDVAVAGNYAYVADGHSGLRIIDVSNPSSPREAGFYDTPYHATSVEVAGDYGYIADYDGGLFILRFTREPATPAGQLWLHAPYSMAPDQAAVAYATVSHIQAQSATYTVVVELWRGFAKLAEQSQSAYFPTSGQQTLAFDFGVHEVDYYYFLAELWSGASLLEVKTAPFAIGLDYLKAAAAVERLSTTATEEINDTEDIAVDALAKASSKGTGEIVGWIFNKVVLSVFDIIGDALEIAYQDIRYAVKKATALVLDFGHAVELASYGEAARFWRNRLDNELYSEQRRTIDRHEQDLLDYARGQTFSWGNSWDSQLNRRREHIRTKLETVQVLGVGLQPKLPFLKWPSLVEQKGQFDVVADDLPGWLDTLSKIAVALLLALLVVVCFLLALPETALLALLGKIAWLVAKLSTLVTALVKVLGLLSKIKFVLAVMVLGFFSFIIRDNAERFVVPAVTKQHQAALDWIREQIQGTQIMAPADVDFSDQVRGHTATLTSTVVDPVQPGAHVWLETQLYRGDGRLIGIFDYPISLDGNGFAQVQDQLELPAGHYKAVSVVHAGGRVPAETRAVTFDIQTAEVQLDVTLQDTNLHLGQVAQAKIIVTNTDTITGTGELLVGAMTLDGVGLSTWSVDMGPGESHSLDWAYVPQAEGGYVMRVVVADDVQPIAWADRGFVVGQAPNVVLDLAYQSAYDPGSDLVLPTVATNVGNEPATTILSIVTLDRMAGLAGVYTETMPLTLGPGESLSLEPLLLPQAEPGAFSTQVFLGNRLYDTFDFLVLAEDTLFANIYPEDVSPQVSQPVTLTVDVQDSTYTYVDATITTTLQRPDGLSETVAMSHTGAGQYLGVVTPPITGTYMVDVTLSKPDCYTVGDETFLVAGQASLLLPLVEGQLVAAHTRPVTVTVTNEHSMPVLDARVVISTTDTFLTDKTNNLGQAAFQVRAESGQSVELLVEKPGFAGTSMDLPVNVIADTVPPSLVIAVPEVTNQSPLTVTGKTEPDVLLTVDGQTVPVGANGIFTTTVALVDGLNIITASATDPSTNTTVVTDTVELDTVGPVLSVAWPPDGAIVGTEVITVTGTTEPGSSLVVSDTAITLDPSGSFIAWVILQPGTNQIPLSAMDAAGNMSSITLSVNYGRRIYMPIIMKNHP